MSEATRILNAIGQGEARAAEELLPLVYDELRKLATHRMAQESGTQTLQPTALVHEAWLRLVGETSPQFGGRAHFFSATAEAMRRILIERARRKLALKHGAGAERVDLEFAELTAPEGDEKLLQVHDALDALAAEDELEAQVVKLRFFVGMTNDEVAEALGVNEKTVRRYWTHAKAWLYERIRGVES